VNYNRLVISSIPAILEIFKPGAMVSKGKSRRRREANLQQAKNDQRLPPPPKASKENQLLPAGLQKMMALKDSLKGIFDS
jgi:hypothetical protein